MFRKLASLVRSRVAFAAALVVAFVFTMSASAEPPRMGSAPAKKVAVHLDRTKCPTARTMVERDNEFPKLRGRFEVLDPTIGGPSANLLAGSNRRSVYGHIDRLALPGLFRTFDFPSPDATSARIMPVTTPLIVWIRIWSSGISMSQAERQTPRY